jgi:hypothetical protein
MDRINPILETCSLIDKLFPGSQYQKNTRMASVLCLVLLAQTIGAMKFAGDGSIPATGDGRYDFFQDDERAGIRIGGPECSGEQRKRRQLYCQFGVLLYDTLFPVFTLRLHE